MSARDFTTFFNLYRPKPFKKYENLFDSPVRYLGKSIFPTVGFKLIKKTSVLAQDFTTFFNLY